MLIDYIYMIYDYISSMQQLSCVECSHVQRGACYIRYPTYAMRGQDPVRDWSLVIEKVTLEDDGIFQCQVLSMSQTDGINIDHAIILIILIIVSSVTKSLILRLDLEANRQQSGRLLPS